MSYSYSSNLDPAAVILLLVAGIALYIYYAYTLSRIFAKAGVAGWQAWVPFLNTWRVLQLGGQPGWWVLVALVPFVGSLLLTVFTIIALYNIGRGFGKSGAFVLLGIFLSAIWYGILAFDSSQWRPVVPPLLPAPTA